MFDVWLEILSSLISESSWFAPILALLAGVVGSFTPCSLSSIPLIIGYVGSGKSNSSKSAFVLSLIFAIGSALIFTILGVSATLAGDLIGTKATWWYMILGVLMLLMELQMWWLYEIFPSTYLVSKNTHKSYLGVFLAGILGGVFSSLCSTPVLIALLALVAGNGSLAWGCCSYCFIL